MAGKLEEAILALIEKRRAATAESRAAIYTQLRAATERGARERGQTEEAIGQKLRLLDRTVAEVEARHLERGLATHLDDELLALDPQNSSATVVDAVAATTQPEQQVRHAGDTRRSIAIFVAALVLVAAALAAAMQGGWFGDPDVSVTPSAEVAGQGDMASEMAAIAEKIIAGADAAAIRTEIGDVVMRRGAAEAQRFLASGYQSIDKAAIETIHFEVARAAYEGFGSEWAAYNLGLDLLSGYGTPRDVDRAAEIFEKLIQLGHSGAEHHMAKLLLDETYHSPDRERAIRLLESASSKGFAQSTALLKTLR